MEKPVLGGKSGRQKPHPLPGGYDLDEKVQEWQIEKIGQLIWLGKWR